MQLPHYRLLGSHTRGAICIVQSSAPELALDVLAVVIREELGVVAEEHKRGRLDARLCVVGVQLMV